MQRFIKALRLQVTDNYVTQHDTTGALTSTITLKIMLVALVFPSPAMAIVGYFFLFNKSPVDYKKKCCFQKALADRTIHN